MILFLEWLASDFIMDAKWQDIKYLLQMSHQIFELFFFLPIPLHTYNHAIKELLLH